MSPSPSSLTLFLSLSHSSLLQLPSLSTISLSLLSLPLMSNNTGPKHIINGWVSISNFLNWIALFSSLKDLSIRVSHNYCNGYSSYEEEELDAELGLETLNLSGITRADDSDSGFGWLWRSCKKLKKLQLESCESIGGDDLSFIKCLKHIEEKELRSCRSIVGLILLRFAENCDRLKSVLIYDGGSEQGLLHFIRNCRSILQKIDLRLPLDFNNVHLSTIGINMRGLSSLRLQSCCLENGEGLKGLNPGIEGSKG
ncbi:uncharacterized protein [Euphorbia lathyris]|uniref:uncharacterized protein n=1 Tax=Euphorbia lathyris TaxID=212925 RepID=UPI0033130A20